MMPLILVTVTDALAPNSYFLVLAFADAGNVWLMEAVNFARVGTLLALNTVVEVKRLPVNLKRFRRKLPSHIADQAPAIVRKRRTARWASPCLRPFDLKRMIRS